jgi:gamma-glutamyltranspeptidase/glutathione hydrolase
VLVFLSLVLAGSVVKADDPSSLGVPGVLGGVVTASEPAAAQVGADILRQGGNAIDAAVAVQFALNVVEPESSGIGGGSFMMIYLAREKRIVIVDSRETAPAAADPGMFLSASDPSKPFPFDISSTSGIAVGVPGTVRGVAAALSHWGTLSFAEVLKPAIKMAVEGIRVSSYLADSILSPRLDSEPGNPAYEVARSVFRPNGVALKKGDLLRQPELAKTLRLLADQGPDAFYTGEIAQAIVATQRHARKVSPPDDQARLTGRMTLADLVNYKAVIRTPVEGRYRGYRIVSMPPPSAGGLTVLQVLKLLERFPIGDAKQGYGFGAARTLHVMIEAMRLAFADRATWMGDADFVPVPAAGLLHNDYIALRSAQIKPDSRQIEVAAGDPRPFEGTTLRPLEQLLAIPIPAAEGVNTTHFAVVDRDGNIVTCTSTIEDTWGTGLMVPGYGFLLNNELTDFNQVPAFNPDPHHFNPGANDVAPGKRPRSSMAPTLIFHDQQPLAAYGAPGGATIIGSVVNMTLNLIDHRLPVQEAIDAPRLVQTSANGITYRESGFAEEVVLALRNLGHMLAEPADIGAVQAVIIAPRDQSQFGGADKRRIGSVISVRRDEIKGN